MNKIIPWFMSLFGSSALLKITVQELVARGIRDKDTKDRVGKALSEALTVSDVSPSIENLRSRVINSIKMHVLNPSERELVKSVMNNVIDEALSSSIIKKAPNQLTQIQKFRDIIAWANEATKW